MRAKAQELWETDLAAQWLQQFDPPDRKVAHLLLEGIQLIDHAAFEQELSNLMIEERRSDINRPWGLFAVREFDKSEWIPAAITSLSQLSKDDLPQIVTKPRYKPSYFGNLRDDERPSAAGREADIGSEGLVANLLRNLQISESEKKFLEHPSLKSMRAVRCRTIALVDDFIGSGRRMTKFVAAFNNHPTIRSWRSYGLIKIFAMAYAGTQQGIKYVLRHTKLDGVIVSVRIMSGSPIWSKNEEEEVKNLCRKYAPLTKKEGAALGYKNAFSMVVFEHKCPNTSPVILWAQASSWHGLFREAPQRGLPAWPIITDEEKTIRAKKILQVFGQKRLSEASWEKYLSPVGQKRMRILAAIGSRIRKLDEICGYAEISTRILAELLSECKSLGWITDDLRLTEKGKAELEKARNYFLDREMGNVLKLKTDYYFPKSLRKARSTSSDGSLSE